MFSQMCACRIGVERKVFKNDWLLLVLYITVTSVVRESCIHCCRSLDIVSVYFRSPEEKSSCWPDEIKLYTTTTVLRAKCTTTCKACIGSITTFLRKYILSY